MTGRKGKRLSEMNMKEVPSEPRNTHCVGTAEVGEYLDPPVISGKTVKILDTIMNSPSKCIFDEQSPVSSEVARRKHSKPKQVPSLLKKGITPSWMEPT